MASAAAIEGDGMTVLSRVERLSLVLSCLEEIKAGGVSSRWWSSSTSITSSSGGGMTATDGGNSSANSPPKNRCRSMEEMVGETQLKGSLVDRITGLEFRLLKLEEELESERKSEIERSISPNNSSEKKKKHSKSFKSMVKTCVRGDLKTKD